MKSLIPEIRRKWKPRSKNSHKGNFGRVLIVAGSRGLSGAAHLASAAAVRSGAGLVTLAVPDTIYPIAARREAEVMVRPFPATDKGTFSVKAFKPLSDFSETQDVLAAGPGLSTHPETIKLVHRLIQSTDIPLVLDADALNALRGSLQILKHCRERAVLTPHPGEFQRMFGQRVTYDSRDRCKKASALAGKYRVTVVLKGAHTVVASPDGEVYVNATGNPGMATGGTGDVLTGMIAALIGQGFSIWDAARFAVYIHGSAGDRAAAELGQISLTASDILRFLPSTFKKILRF